ncbi:MAG: hypothetical protein GY778_23110 [bacterium]|nr:hypothetical protein [bacterium]
MAQALAELVEGATFDFLHPGCYFVTSGESGSLIELYRKEIELHPGESGKPCELLDTKSPARFTGSHTAIRVSANADRVLEVADAYGWRAEIHRRRVFRVIEFWIENEYLLEVFPPEFASEYLAACELVSSSAPKGGIA